MKFTRTITTLVADTIAVKANDNTVVTLPVEIEELPEKKREEAVRKEAMKKGYFVATVKGYSEKKGLYEWELSDIMPYAHYIGEGR